MSRSEFEKAKRDYMDYVKARGIEHCLFYGPTTPAYWSTTPKVLMVNAEPHHCQNFGRYEINEQMLMSWMREAQHRTVRYSVAFASVLLDRLRDPSKAVLSEDFRKAYRDVDRLKMILREITYFNIKPTSNVHVAQDATGIRDVTSSTLAQFLRREILALEADVLIVSGAPATGAISDLLGVTGIHPKGEPVRSGQTIVKSMSHFSRPDYQTYADAVEKIAGLC